MADEKKKRQLGKKKPRPLKQLGSKNLGTTVLGQRTRAADDAAIAALVGSALPDQLPFEVPELEASGRKLGSKNLGTTTLGTTTLGTTALGQRTRVPTAEERVIAMLGGPGTDAPGRNILDNTDPKPTLIYPNTPGQSSVPPTRRDEHKLGFTLFNRATEPLIDRIIDTAEPTPLDVDEFVREHGAFPGSAATRSEADTIAEAAAFEPRAASPTQLAFGAGGQVPSTRQFLAVPKRSVPVQAAARSAQSVQNAQSVQGQLPRVTRHNLSGNTRGQVGGVPTPAASELPPAQAENISAISGITGVPVHVLLALAKAQPTPPKRPTAKDSARLLRLSLAQQQYNADIAAAAGDPELEARALQQWRSELTSIGADDGILETLAAANFAGN